MKYSTLILALLLVVSSAMAAAQGTLVDKRDGKKYKTVQIGSQTWMAENLNYKTKDSYCYDDDESNCSEYGRLYMWKVAKEACPSGWHLPSKADFETLIESVGGNSTAGLKLKSKTNWNGSNTFGFSADPVGVLDDGGGYYDERDVAYFWSSTEKNSSNAHSMGLSTFNDKAYLSDSNKDAGFSVRCLQD